jgi:hypothetical protein
MGQKMLQWTPILIFVESFGRGMKFLVSWKNEKKNLSKHIQSHLAIYYLGSHHSVVLDRLPLILRPKRGVAFLLALDSKCNGNAKGKVELEKVSVTYPRERKKVK